MERFVIYTRVSTNRQGKSGLGLEAQERDIQVYFDSYAETPYEVLGRFCDVDSGGNDARPELTEAIALAKKEQATLLVAKLDRLSRKLSFIVSLVEDKRLAFRVVSMPYADKVQLYIYAILAEQERDFISLRTKAALKAAKARGVKLGGERPEAQRRHDAVKATADENARRVSNVILRSRKIGRTYRDIADELNQLGVQTARGGRWYAMQVRRYSQRLL
ncbi:recombinase family protein [Streptomyces albidoflavus]|uniref:recombinase family protein n=1 Tax=Streptomyces albidoflavus TaxID=1886 RepID=UPI00345110E0